MAQKKTVLIKVLIVIGVILVIFLMILIGLIAYIIYSKPFGIDINLLSNQDSQSSTSYDHPLLSDEQENMLKSIGVDLETVPTSITPEQEQCAVNSLGQDRVDQIKAGASPSLTDYLKAKDCF